MIANSQICYHPSCGVARLSSIGRCERASTTWRSVTTPRRRHLADPLTRFARTENLYPRGVTMPARLRGGRRPPARGGDRLGGSEALQPSTRSPCPGIGDFTLFVTGIFRERVEAYRASIGYYITQGKRAYHFVWEHDRRQLARLPPTRRPLPEARRRIRHATRAPSTLHSPRVLHRPSPAPVLPAPLLDDRSGRRPRSGIAAGAFSRRLSTNGSAPTQNTHGADALPGAEPARRSAPGAASAARQTAGALPSRSVVSRRPPAAAGPRGAAPRPARRARVSSPASTGADRARRGSCSRAPTAAARSARSFSTTSSASPRSPAADITKRRLEAELASLRAAQKLPWVEADPARAVGLVAESLQIHRERGTAPPSAFGRWQSFFTEIAALEPPPAPVANADMLARSDELLGLPELGGWFLDPETVQSDALEISRRRARAASWSPTRSRPSGRRPS